MSDDEEYAILDPERDRGIFTTADREYLLGERELSDQAERNTRHRIRNRLQNGIYDLGLAARLRTKDRRQVANDIFTDDFTGDSILYDSLGLLFHMVTNAEEGDTTKTTEKFEEVLAGVVESVTKQENDDVIVDVTVSIDPDVQRPNIDELLERYENSEETYEEFQFLREQEEIEADEQFWRHSLRHSWEREVEFSLVTPDGEMESIDPGEFDTLQKFTEAGIELWDEIRRRYQSEE